MLSVQSGFPADIERKGISFVLLLEAMKVQV